MYGGGLQTPDHQGSISYIGIRGYSTGVSYDPVNTKHLYNICTMLNQRRRRWADVVQMLYKCFEFAGFEWRLMVVTVLLAYI